MQFKHSLDVLQLFQFLKIWTQLILCLRLRTEYLIHHVHCQILQQKSQLIKKYLIVSFINVERWIEFKIILSYEQNPKSKIFFSYACYV